MSAKVQKDIAFPSSTLVLPTPAFLGQFHHSGQGICLEVKISFFCSSLGKDLVKSELDKVSYHYLYHLCVLLLLAEFLMSPWPDRHLLKYWYLLGHQYLNLCSLSQLLLLCLGKISTSCEKLIYFTLPHKKEIKSMCVWIFLSLLELSIKPYKMLVRHLQPKLKWDKSQSELCYVLRKRVQCETIWN